MNKDARLAVRIPAKLLKESKAVAKRRKLSLSSMIQELLESAVAADQLTRTTIDAEQV